MPPEAPEPRAGRPALDPEWIRQKLRDAKRDLGDEATKAAMAERLGIDVRTLSRWQKVSD